MTRMKILVTRVTITPWTLVIGRHLNQGLKFYLDMRLFMCLLRI